MRTRLDRRSGGEEHPRYAQLLVEMLTGFGMKVTPTSSVTEAMAAFERVAPEP